MEAPIIEEVIVGLAISQAKQIWLGDILVSENSERQYDEQGIGIQ